MLFKFTTKNYLVLIKEKKTQQKKINLRKTLANFGTGCISQNKYKNISFPKLLLKAFNAFFFYFFVLNCWILGCLYIFYLVYQTYTHTHTQTCKEKAVTNIYHVYLCTIIWNRVKMALVLFKEITITPRYMHTRRYTYRFLWAIRLLMQSTKHISLLP